MNDGLSDMSDKESENSVSNSSEFSSDAGNMIIIKDPFSKP